MNLKTIGILITVIFLQACATKKNEHLGTKIMWVSGYKADCDAGAGKKQCLLVAKEADLAEANWEYFYNSIEGFTFEPGIVQKIEVIAVERPVEEMAQDRSSLKYELVKVLAKKTDTRWDLEGQWTVNKINGIEAKSKEELPSVQFDLTRSQFSGNNGCNNFSGVIQNVNTSDLRLERTLTTLRICDDMPIADQFDAAFAKIKSYKIENNRLSFCDDKNQDVLSFTKKPTSTADIRIHDIYVAIAIDGEAINKRDEMPRFEINLNTMEVFGNNGCNEFNGKITSITERNISFGTIAMTRKMCRDMVLPGKFDKALQQTASYKFENLHLTLYGKEGKELIKFLKVD